MNKNRLMKDEIKAYGFGISEVDAVKHSDAIKTAKGLIGVHLHPQGLLVIFRTENDAKICRNIMEYDGCRVGRKIIEVYVKKDEMEGGHAD